MASTLTVSGYSYTLQRGGGRQAPLLLCSAPPAGQSGPVAMQWPEQSVLSVHGPPMSASASLARTLTYDFDIRDTSINLLAGEQSKVSSMGQVPRLDWTDGEGTRHSLTQSIAIIQLLDDVYGAAGGSPAGWAG